MNTQYNKEMQIVVKIQILETPMEMGLKLNNLDSWISESKVVKKFNLACIFKTMYVTHRKVSIYLSRNL